MYHNQCIPCGIEFTTTASTRTYAVLETLLKRKNVRQTVNETVPCTLGLIIFYLELQKVSSSIIYIIFILHNITCLIHTNFTQ